ncbi:MAG: UvrD-helicase domain-containing protein [Rickettsiales bacterium]|nr:UvrD-helicase domain-containing protein [Rickettsiales bacterium]
MQDLLESLNEGQRQAVLTTEGPLLVLSGAGTGKTRVLTTRIAHILQSGLAEPWQILALTFTNKAAGEMKTRLRGLVGDMVEGVWMGTFHSIGLRILRANAPLAGLKNPFVILNDDDQESVIKNILKSMNQDPKQASDIAGRISLMKDTGRNRLNESEQKVFDAYQAELERMNAVDFGDLIIKPIKMLIDNRDILKKYQQQFLYVLVDEYQDTNASQYQLMRLLASGSGNICCVGDDDQSIYSWRGSEVKNILGFQNEYKGAQVIRLEKNYRSTPEILGAANSLIKNNKERLGKNLEATKSGGDKVQIIRVWSDLAEAQGIADAIQDMARDGENYSDMAVLIRSASLSRLFEEEFVNRKIPYRLVGGTKFYDRAEIRDAIAYARLLAYPFDDVAFARIFNTPKRSLGDAALAQVRDYARANHLSLLDALHSMPLPPRMAKGAAEFAKIFSEARDMADSAPPAEVFQALLDRAGYIKMWNESKELDAKERLDRIRDLIGTLKDGYSSLEDFLEQVALYTSNDEDGVSGDAVSVMTMHAAKGLEFKNVFLPAWEEGIFPNERALGEFGAAALEEERRLAYVAITRAIRRAVISLSGSRLLFGQRINPRPSMFIDEIEERFADRVGFNKGYIQSEMPTDARMAPPTEKSRGDFSTFPQGGSSPFIGRMVAHEELGRGVVIQLDGDIATVAFRDAGMKKVKVEFLEFDKK